MFSPFRRIIFSSFSLGIFLLFSIPCAFAEESISDFRAEINVQKNSDLAITETIQYDFGEANHHGIVVEWDETFSGNTTIKSITDEKGTPYPFSMDRSNGILSVQIGAPEVLATGEKTYILNYTVEREISFFSDHDELYWDVNGTTWGVPIQKTSAMVSFPTEIQSSKLQAECYTGYPEENTSNCTHSTESKDGKTYFYFESTSPLLANQGQNQNLTIVAGIPTGILKMPTPLTAKELLLKKAKEEWKGFLVAFLILGTASLVWWFKGKDPKSQNPIVAQYEPPQKLACAEIQMLANDKLTPSILSSTIFELGVKGLLVLQKEDEKKSDLTFIKKRDPTPNELSPFQVYVFNKIFPDSTTQKRPQKELRNKFLDFETQGKPIVKSLVDQGYYATRPKSGYYWGIFLLGFASIFLGQQTFPSSSMGAMGIMVSGMICIIIANRMTKKTQQGADLQQKIKGFKLFLNVTEKDRLAFHNPPSQSIDLFQKMLPYAVALGVEKKWADYFKTFIDTEIHNRRYSCAWLPINLLQGANSSLAISSLNQSIASSLCPSRSGHSSSGFHGGFSGGGGGSHGGRSW